MSHFLLSCKQTVATQTTVDKPVKARTTNRTGRTGPATKTTKWQSLFRTICEALFSFLEIQTCCLGGATNLLLVRPCRSHSFVCSTSPLNGPTKSEPLLSLFTLRKENLTTTGTSAGSVCSGHLTVTSTSCDVLEFRPKVKLRHFATASYRSTGPLGVSGGSAVTLTTIVESCIGTILNERILGADGSANRKKKMSTHSAHKSATLSAIVTRCFFTNQVHGEGATPVEQCSSSTFCLPWEKNVRKRATPTYHTRWCERCSAHYLETRLWSRRKP